MVIISLSWTKTKINLQRKCNCVNRNECPLGNECQASNIVYKAELSCNNPNYQAKAYIGICATTFKPRYANHKKSFNHEKYKFSTELSNEYWKLKVSDQQPNVKFSILKKCKPTTNISKCHLCLNEKLFILENIGKNLLNQRSELVSTCRHKAKFMLSNHKT